MTPVASYSSLRHYQDHLAGILDALQTATTPILGGVHAPQGRPWGDPLPRDRYGTLWLVASGADAQRVGPAPVIYCEHGAGQGYAGDPTDERACRSGSYAGGEGLDHVVLFLCPNESVAARWRATYPETPAVVVGCPKLDRFHVEQPLGSGAKTGTPTVAVAFHWPNTLCPESQWALPHYRGELGRLRDAVRADGGELIGHGHPRAWRQLRREWVRLGIEPVEHLAEVMDRADLLVVDNSSIAFEFASTGRPVVWMSAPWYRRDVDHGMRFWKAVEGMPHVDEPEQLAPTVLAALADPAASVEARARMVAMAYSACDGLAAERAATAIMEVSRTWETRSPHA